MSQAAYPPGSSTYITFPRPRSHFDVVWVKDLGPPKCWLEGYFRLTIRVMWVSLYFLRMLFSTTSRPYLSSILYDGLLRTYTGSIWFNHQIVPQLPLRSLIYMPGSISLIPTHHLPCLEETIHKQPHCL